MDKSSRVEKSVIKAGLDSLPTSQCLSLVQPEGSQWSLARQAMRRVGTFAVIFLISLFITFSTHIKGFCAEMGSFHINAKDLNLLNLESLLEKHSPGIKYDGQISLSADVTIEKGVETVSSGTFSSDKVSFFADNFLFPIEFSQLAGEFIVNVKGGLPTIDAKIKRSMVQWGKLSARDLKADCSLHEKNLVIKNGEIQIAGGTVYVSGNIDFGKTPAVFNLKMDTKSVDIGILSQQWSASRAISGILFSDASFSGELGKPTSLFGKAKINIEKGELGKVGLIGRMITFSPLAAMSKDFALTTFDGDFDISEGYAYTENAVLKGPEIRITAKGDIGWNKKLNFVLGLYTSSELLKGTSITKTLGTIIDGFGNVLRKVRLTGTIDNPSFTIMPLGIGETIVDGLKRSFGGGRQKEVVK